jgi:FAD/FMN-containing dehydrogenase
MFQLIERIRQIVGSAGLIEGDDVRSRSDGWPPVGGCRARAVVRPADTGEVSAVLRLCNEAGQPVVTHGGLTGLVGGARTGPGELALSMERMSDVGAVDSVNRTLIAEAGAPLQKVQATAEDAGLLFPVDLGARGTATIGGNISTNAGGNSVIRYGMTREQLLGVEAVLADGTIISSMKDVIKNNTGYDLKQLFVGAEGTLGIVTRAVLRLRPLPRSRNTALLALDSFEHLTGFLSSMDAALGGTLSAFEVMWNDCYRLLVADDGAHGVPLDGSHPFYVLLEATGGHEDSDRRRFEESLEAALTSGAIVDAVVAQSRQQRQELWAIRDDVETMMKKLSPPLTFDISLRIPLLDEYVTEVRSALESRWPQARLITFGHLGDGNIHLVLTVGSLDPEAVRGVEEIVYGALGRRGGVISAEHGIGLEKRAYLSHSRSPEEMALMKTLKSALDPKNILNPGKVL